MLGGRRGPVIWIIALLCAVEVLILAIGLAGPGVPRARSAVVSWTGFIPSIIGGGDGRYPGQALIMFFSYGFVHGGVFHLAVNVISLGTLGPAVLDRLGRCGFILTYLAGLFGGGIGFALLAGQGATMVGASGAIFGLAGALLAWEWRARLAEGLSRRPVVNAIGMLVFLNVALWWAMGGLLAWEAHLGGFLAGWALGAQSDLSV